MFCRHYLRRVDKLDGIWDFKFIGEKIQVKDIDINKIKFNEFIPVPSAFDIISGYKGRRGVAAYKINFYLAAKHKAVLKFNSVAMVSYIYIDRKFIMKHIGGYTMFECEVPVSDKEIRELIIIVDNRYKNSILYENNYDFYNYGGILRGVELHWVGETYIEQIKVNATDIKNFKVYAEISLGGKFTEHNKIYIIVDNVQKYVFEVNKRIIKFNFTLKKKKKWDIENPNLHIIRVIYNGDDMQARFGVRKISAKDGKIYLNEKVVKLKGVCWHESHPQYGAAVPLNQLYQDLLKIKDLNFNFIRGVHYPLDNIFLDMCDEVGILVWEESLGWQQKNKHFKSKKYKESLKKHINEMILSHINHPAIIIWGFLNEGQSDSKISKKFYKSVIEHIRSLDNTRLVTYASDKFEKDLSLEYADIVSFNLYPGWYSEDFENINLIKEVPDRIFQILKFLKREKNLKNKPFIISEIGAGAIYGFRDELNGFWTEAYQSEYFRVVLELVLSNNDISGVALWQFADTRTYNGSRALNRPRGFNNKGIMDEYRRPKQSYFTVKEILYKFKRK